MRRTGIDLSSVRCNIVDAEPAGRRRRAEPAVFRVHDYASLTHLDNAQALTSALTALIARGTFSRRAWVNLWDVRSSHQYLLIPPAPDAEIEAKARRHGASVLGLNELDVTVATSMGGMRGEPGHHLKREVSFFAAGSDDIRARLRPLVDAGFLIEGVTTPCGALWSQARLRRASSLPVEVHAYVALGLTQSALGIFSDGSLLYARDLDWGYAGTAVSVPVTQNRHVIAERLGTELRRSFLYLKQYWDQDVSQVLLCGDMPEIRSLTAPLIERLNIEVETLDTLDGIDVTSVPEGFADLAPVFRLASSIAVEPPPVNLLPVEVTAGYARGTGWRSAAAGTMAVIAMGALLYGHASATRAEAERQLDAVRRETLSLGAAHASTSTTAISDGALSMGQAELSALGTQGQMLSRVMEALGRVTPQQITLRSLRVVAAGAQWTVSVDALAAGDQEAADKAADLFLRSIGEAAIFAGPLRPPTRRFVSDAPGVEIDAAYVVRK